MKDKIRYILCQFGIHYYKKWSNPYIQAGTGYSYQNTCCEYCNKVKERKSGWYDIVFKGYFE